MRGKRPSIWGDTGALLRGALQLVRAGGARLCGLILVTQLLILLVALPVISWLFREALRANGMAGLDLGQLPVRAGFPLTVSLIVAIVVLVFWILALQFTALVVLLRWPRLSGRQYVRELGRVARALLRPAALPLLGYLFVLVPLTGFGFTSALTRGLAIPQFISGELFKAPATTVGFLLFLLVLAWLNVRFSLTVPVFILTAGRRPLRTSWRLTSGPRTWAPLVLAATVVLALGSLAGSVLAAIALAPTAAADALLPPAAAGTAAVSLGIAQVLGMLLSGLVTAGIAALLITQLRRTASRLPKDGTLLPYPEPSRAGVQAASARQIVPAVLAIAVVLAIGCSAAGWGTMHRLAAAPESLVLAHRGFSAGGVENTLGGLDAAARAGADLVEMDVMQTSDGGFVAMHDAQLDRLAGRPDAVKDLTLAELTSITVRDANGHEDHIPSFSAYVQRAQELEMPLLIEIKIGGGETPDHVDRLVAELEELGALNENIYHSLEAPSVERLKLLRPDLTVGYTMAFAGGGIPETVADFIVVEQWTATAVMQDAAWGAGLGFMAWTVNDEAGYREHLRRNTDGIITDVPDLVLAARAEMQHGSGMAAILFDALTRFVTVV
ncbi:glycerophosphoryl diester phosphodiesterase [Leucobacter luti]|uniref:Glycerophosphoryl diester phosphodiesterase n=1 Tax=Leucobacter luti TaxID=340320 RepID=A0A4R6RV42_9MICO|nr:glycerophosphoryl diester phosphodiesterase membrane domain-containing protein [Leucobacter luti]TDP90822.1 glycerophosphoryl diester phosphodiesterase [Leucobacter luti]